MNIIIALIVLSLIVIFHEFGHFIIAKSNGICVKEFTLGLGPTLISFGKGETKYCLKLLPFGGSCVMLGEDTEENINEERAFVNKPVWARISTIAAGPIFNFILAFVLALFVIGYVGYDPCKVAGVTQGTPAYDSGLSEGDTITKVNGKKITFYRDYALYLQLNMGKTLELTYTTADGETKTTIIEPEYVEKKVYQMGISMGENIEVLSVAKDSAAESAGIMTGDIIKAIDGKELTSYEDVSPIVQACNGNALELTIERDGNTQTVTLTPKMVDQSGYAYGILLSGAREKVSPIKVIGYGFSEVRYWIEVTIKSLSMLVTGKVSANQVSGPVGIVNMIGNTVEQSRSEGMLMVLVNLAELSILLSANLGVMNLLPIPALDGGRLVFLLIELVRGKPVNREKEGLVHFIGMVILMIIMVLVLFNDVRNLL